jgi:hypothetical protein
VEAPWNWYAERNQLFANDGRGRFRDLSDSAGPFCGTPGVYRSLVCGDFDGDGAVDLLVTQVAGSARLFRNTAPKRGHWLSLRLIDPILRRDAYGALATIEAGDRRWTRELIPGSSYLCSHEPVLHVGLGAAERVDRVLVRWPDGTKEAFAGPVVDRAVVLRKGTGSCHERSE